MARRKTRRRNPLSHITQNEEHIMELAMQRTADRMARAEGGSNNAAAKMCMNMINGMTEAANDLGMKCACVSMPGRKFRRVCMCEKNSSKLRQRAEAHWDAATRQHIQAHPFGALGASAREGCRDSSGEFVPVPQCRGRRGGGNVHIEIIEEDL